MIHVIPLEFTSQISPFLEKEREKEEYYFINIFFCVEFFALLNGLMEDTLHCVGFMRQVTRRV